MVKDLTSLVVDSEGVRYSNHGKALLLNLKHFFPHWLVCLYSHCWSFKVFVIEAMLSIIYANFLLFHVFIVSLDLKSYPFLNLNCILKVLWSFNMSTHSRYFFYVCSSTALCLPIKFRQLDSSKRNFVSISEWAINIGIANRMLFLLLTKSTFWSAEFYSD